MCGGVGGSVLGVEWRGGGAGEGRGGRTERKRRPRPAAALSSCVYQPRRPRHSPQGCVYVKFGSAEAAAAAAQVLHGRYYNGHMIQASFQYEAAYNVAFGL